ncbi:PAS domain-containing protein [Roseivirga echinicomitans]
MRSTTKDTRELRKKEREQKMLLAALNDSTAVSMVDLHGNITFVNKNLCAISGYKKKDLLGQSHTLIYTNAFFSTIWDQVLKGKAWKGELCSRKKNGEQYWMLVSFTPNKNNKDEVDGYTSIQTDITAHKQSQNNPSFEHQSIDNTFDLNEAQRIAKIGSFNSTLSLNEVWWSNELYALFGLDPHNFIPSRKALYELIHPEDRGIFTQLLQSLIANKRTQSEFRAKHANGKWITLELIAQAKYDEYNNFNGSRGTIQNITERKEAIAALKYAYNIINRSPAVVFRWKNIEDLPVDFVSKNVFELSGYSAEDFLNKRIRYDDIIHPDDLQRVAEEVTKADNSGENNMYHHEPYRLITKQGTIKWVLDTTYIRRNTGGKVMFREGIVYDITKQREAEESLRKSESLLADMSKTAKIGGWELSLGEEPLQVEWTEEVFSIHELEPNQFPSLQDGINFYHPDDRATLEDAIKEAIEQGTPYNLELRIITAKNNQLWVRAICRPFIINGVVTKLTGTLQNITNRKNAELSIQHHLQLLKQKNKELNQFAYIASHDLQEPLRTVTNFVDLLNTKHKGTLDSDSNLYLNYITNSVARMQDLLHALLEYTSIGNYDKAPRSVNCDAILEQVRNDLSTQIGEKSAKLTVHPLPQVIGHEHELRSLFQNLISNAIKFCKPDSIPQIDISVNKVEHQWVFCVKDNGIGIEEEYREKIFVIFKRLHNQDEYQGTGIGLARCLKIVELHGGEIWVESKPNEGSAFYFSIPN